jgi:hypothetical protein
MKRLAVSHWWRLFFDGWGKSSRASFANPEGATRGSYAAVTRDTLNAAVGLFENRHGSELQ